MIALFWVWVAVTWIHLMKNLQVLKQSHGVLRIDQSMNHTRCGFSTVADSYHSVRSLTETKPDSSSATCGRQQLDKKLNPNS